MTDEKKPPQGAVQGPVNAGSSGTQSASGGGMAAHPSLSAPWCINCVHMEKVGALRSMCAHPQAERDLVHGQAVRHCCNERESPQSFCGPEGRGFLPDEKKPPKGTAEVSVKKEVAGYENALKGGLRTKDDPHWKLFGTDCL